MVRRRTGRDEGPNWPLLAGIAAGVAMLVAAVLAPRRHFRTAGPASAAGHGVVATRPARSGRAVRTREGRDDTVVRKRSARGFAVNWPLALGIAAALFLIWLWWWSATQGGPG